MVSNLQVSTKFQEKNLDAEEQPSTSKAKDESPKEAKIEVQ